MNSGLILTVLGSLELAGDGAQVPKLVYRKSLALLCYLAVTGRLHSRDALAGLLWGEMPDASAKTSLRKALSDLRRLVGSHLISTRQSVGLDQSDNALRLDHRVLHTRLQALGSRSPEPAILPEAEIAKLIEVANLYRGDFLEGFYVRGAPAFEEWVLVERERVRSLMLGVLHRLVTHYTALANYDAAIDYSTRLLALEPWHEEATRQLMLLLALAGRRGAALHQYQVCRHVLAEELGIEPSPETAALYKRIRAAELGPAGGAAASNLGRPQGQLHVADPSARSPALRLITFSGPISPEMIGLAMGAAAEFLGVAEESLLALPLLGIQARDVPIASITDAPGLQSPQHGEDSTRATERLCERGVVVASLEQQGLEHDPVLRDILRGARQAVILVGQPGG